MKKGFFAAALLTLSFLFIIGTGCQDSGTLAVSGKAGTTGLGGEVTIGLLTDLNARAGLNTMDFDVDEKFDDVEYELGVNFDSMSGLIDWYIFDGSFHLTGGVYSLDHEISLDATPTGSVDIGDTTYDFGDVGTIKGKATIDGLSPYFGIGWGNPMRSNRRWGFTLDLGVIFTDSPEVSLYATGSASTLADDIEKERKKIEDDLDGIKFYPVATLGLFIRF